jgi:glucokinase
MSYSLGLDIGGTNLKALAVDALGQDIATWEHPTGDDGTTNWQNNVRDFIQQITEQLGSPAAATIAAPGLPHPKLPEIALMPGRLQGIEGLQWSRFFPTTTQLRVINDARAALCGEIWRGSAQGKSNVVMLTLGTGVGGAIMVDGHLLAGAKNRAGHLGHISLNPYAPRDCVQTPGSLEDAIGDASLSHRSQGKYQGTWQMLPDLHKGEPFAWTIWQRSIDHLAAGIASLINLFDPEVVVLGGGISKADSLLTSPLTKALRNMEWLYGAPIPITLAQLSSHAGAVGAAWVSRQPRNPTG